MLDYLLDHELFSCMVLLMNLQPGLQRAVITAGLDVPHHDDLQQLLPALARASRLSGSRSPRSPSSGSGGEEEGSSDDGRSSVLLRRLQARAAAAAAAPASVPPSRLEGPAWPAAAVVLPAPVFTATPRAASGGLQDAAAFAGAAASPPSPQLAPIEAALAAHSPEERQQLLEAELERLEARFTGELPLIRVRGRPAEANSRPLPLSVRQSPAQQQWQGQQDREPPAAHAAVPLQSNLRHRQQRRRRPSGGQDAGKDTSLAGSRAAAATAAAKVVDWDDGGWGDGSPQQPCAAACSSPGGGAGPRAGALPAARAAAVRGAAVRGALLGFGDPATEALYVTFKSHYSSLVDTSALLYSFGTWLTCTRRSVSEPRQLLVLVLYCILYFFPYAVMLLARGTFLRHREALLVAGRSTSALMIAAVAALASPGWLPAAWAMAVARTITLHLSHGVLLPACQQVRPRASLAMHAAHFLCDGAMLGTVLPPHVAAAHSLAIQANGLVITSLLDVRARCVFLQRFRGTLRGGGGDAASALPPAGAGGGQPLAVHLQGNVIHR